MRFPTISAIANQVKKVLQGSFNSISQQIKSLPAKISDSVVTKAGKDLGLVVDKAKELTGVLKDAVACAAATVRVIHDIDKGFDANAFRKKLKQFFNDFFAIGAQLPRLLVEMEPPGTVQKNLVRRIVDSIPVIVLLPVSLVFDGVPGWEKMPGKILTLVKKLPSRDELLQPKEINETLYL